MSRIQKDGRVSWYAAAARAGLGLRFGSKKNLIFGPTVGYGHTVAGGPSDLESGQAWFFGAETRVEMKRYWLGAEGTVMRRATNFEDPLEEDETDTGWTLAATAGVPIMASPGTVVSAFGAAGVNEFGGTGSYFRPGLQLSLEPKR